MVPMTMRQDDTEKAGADRGKPIDVGQRRGSKIAGVQRKTEIEQDSASLALQLDTGATNLPRPPIGFAISLRDLVPSYSNPPIFNRGPEKFTHYGTFAKNICLAKQRS